MNVTPHCADALAVQLNAKVDDSGNDQINRISPRHITLFFASCLKRDRPGCTYEPLNGQNISSKVATLASNSTGKREMEEGEKAK